MKKKNAVRSFAAFLAACTCVSSPLYAAMPIGPLQLPSASEDDGAQVIPAHFSISGLSGFHPAFHAPMGGMHVPSMGGHIPSIGGHVPFGGAPHGMPGGSFNGAKPHLNGMHDSRFGGGEKSGNGIHDGHVEGGRGGEMGGRGGQSQNGFGKGGNRDGYGSDGYSSKTGCNHSGFDAKGNYHAEHDMRGGSRGYNKEGYDKDGYNKAGCNKQGYDRNGSYHKDQDCSHGRSYDKQGYDKEGYDKNGYNKNGCDRNGFDHNKSYHKEQDQRSYDKNGYDKSGYDKNGYNKSGCDKNGYDKNGGYHQDQDCRTTNRDGYGSNGYNSKTGCNRNGVDQNGNYHPEHDMRGSSRGYDKEGYDKDGFNKAGCDKKGFDRNGNYHKDQDCSHGRGYDKQGYDKEGYNKNGYNKNGCDRNGYDQNKNYHKDQDQRSYDHNGYDRNGYNKEGYNKNGCDKNGYDQHGGYHADQDCRTSSRNRWEHNEHSRSTPPRPRRYPEGKTTNNVTNNTSNVTNNVTVQNSVTIESSDEGSEITTLLLSLAIPLGAHYITDTDSYQNVAPVVTEQRHRRIVRNQYRCTDGKTMQLTIINNGVIKNLEINGGGRCKDSCQFKGEGMSYSIEHDEKLNSDFVIFTMDDGDQFVTRWDGERLAWQEPTSGRWAYMVNGYFVTKDEAGKSYVFDESKKEFFGVEDLKANGNGAVMTPAFVESDAAGEEGQSFLSHDGNRVVLLKKNGAWLYDSTRQDVDGGYFEMRELTKDAETVVFSPRQGKDLQIVVVSKDGSPKVFDVNGDEMGAPAKPAEEKASPFIKINDVLENVPAAMQNL